MPTPRCLPTALPPEGWLAGEHSGLPEGGRGFTPGQKGPRIPPAPWAVSLLAVEGVPMPASLAEVCCPLVAWAGAADALPHG
jgi:hypothetical protein